MSEAVLGLHARDHEPVEVPPGPAVESGSRADSDGVTLECLLAVATLTPAQAALLVTDATDQFGSVHGRGRAPASLRGDAVTVSAAGRLTIECAGTAGPQGAMRDAAACLLRRIAANCRVATLADRVDDAIAGSSDTDDLMRQVQHTAATELERVDVGRTRSQLSALVAAVRGRARPDGSVDVPEPPLPVTGTVLASNRWHPPVGAVWHRKKRRRSPRRWVLGLVAILVVAGAVWVAPTAWSQLREGWSTLLGPAESAMQDRIDPVSPPPPLPDAAPPPGSTEPGPVDTALPTGAGPITGLTAVFADGSCEAGRACTLRVDIGVDPSANIAAVTWNPVVYDRCTGAVVPGGAVTVPVPSGGRDTYGIGSVDLPPGTALAVAAVTTDPAEAASAPMYVPAEHAICPPEDAHEGG